ncbi:formate dehydrogenase accessory protein FdhE [Salinicola rhizosphaerae]|uniref:Protein FdhE n=1 Tax=Salinicola rhizosphaerae TaxID=1443141 RepID=A0ABQ3EDY0_9GAMM|nr:formate dehydrogenase accessory protein FdhE [Salinicola rhizosphaerae]GHB31678.1 protein FdhE [Salinicola rhizosphaerae]
MSTPEREAGTSAGHAFGRAPESPGAPPMVVLPGRKLFAERVQRLHRLAERLPAMADYLYFMARIVEAQHHVLQMPRPRLTDSADLAIAHDIPPLAVDGLWRDMSWPQDLDALIADLDEDVPAAQRAWFERIKALAEPERMVLAAGVLSGEIEADQEIAMAPLMGAALQVAWTRQARGIAHPPGRPKAGARALCPCCGVPPVASVIQIGMARSRVRYLHCGLCATEWYAERARCAYCGDSRTLAYETLEDERGERVLPVQAETCGACESYLKVAQREWEQDADPLADDLASLALDMMIGERELARRAFNPLLVLGRRLA